MNLNTLWVEKGEPKEVKEMKKTFDFGKIDFEGKGKTNLVTVEMEYKDKGDGKKALSICGNIWNRRKTDIVCGGQCLDTIAEYISDPVFAEIYRLWKLYHSNDMHAECEHQHALGWDDLAKEEVTLYHWTLTSDVLKQQREIEKLALNTLKSCESFTPTKEQSYIYSLSYSITTEDDKMTAEQQKFYQPRKALHAGDTGHEERKKIGWLKEKEHSKGILSKPCPVCGYKYGSSWVYFPIPENDEKIIIDLITKQAGKQS